MGSMPLEVGDSITLVHRDFVALCEVTQVRPRGEEPTPAPQTPAEDIEAATNRSLAPMQAVITDMILRGPR